MPVFDSALFAPLAAICAALIVAAVNVHLARRATVQLKLDLEVLKAAKEAGLNVDGVQHHVERSLRELYRRPLPMVARWPRLSAATRTLFSPQALYGYMGFCAGALVVAAQFDPRSTDFKIDLHDLRSLVGTGLLDGFLVFLACFLVWNSISDSVRRYRRQLDEFRGAELKDTPASVLVP